MRARAFGPGLPPTGVDATLALDGGAVTLALAGDGLPSAPTAPLSALRLRSVGFGRPGVELAWDDAGGETWRAHVLDPEAAAELLARPDVAALPSAAALRRDTRRRGGLRAAGWAVIALFVASPLLLLALVWANADRLAALLVERIPVAQEMQFGRAAWESLAPQLELQDDTPTAARVRELGARLAAGSAYRYEFHLADDAVPNAFALPGGIIVVNRGLIALTRRPEDLAGVLAHEVEHVERRHGLAALAKQLGWRAAWTLFTGDWGGGFAGEAAAQLGSLAFSRDAEREADARAVTRLTAAGIDPAGLRDALRALAAEAARDGAPEAPGFLSTHPAGKERVEALEAGIAASGARRYVPLDAAGWPPAD